MQYRSKIALLAVALFGTSALAAPFTSEVEYDVEARDVDNDLTTREFYEMYVEARDLESMDFEAREYLEYLEARQAATVATPQTPLSPKSSKVETIQTPLSPKSSKVETHEQSKLSTATTGKKQVFLTKHQRAVRQARKNVDKEFKKDPELYHHSLLDKNSKYHNFAVLEYLHTPSNLKKAYRNKKSPYHSMAMRLVHQRKAKTYLADKKNFKKALKNKRNKYNKDAVKMYLSQGTHFQEALTHKKSRFHKVAVHQYLLDTKTRKLAIANEEHPFHRQAEAMQKKINKQLRKQHKLVAATANSTTTATNKA